ncbi:MAG: hypothetical protein QM714_02695 [Nocardioides sp.]|uniref:phage tail tube protein n=1 Tax=Nocardioides sp. TaxID=35761 RepID=UPI0039E26247
MAAPVRPTPSKAYGTEKIIFCPTQTLSVATLTGATALDVTKMFFESSARPDATANMVESPPRVGDIESYEFVGATKWTLGEVRYSYNPQGAALSDGVKAFEKFPAGTTGYLYFRGGLNRDTDLATGQFAEEYPVEFGPQVITKEGDGEGAEWAVKQGVAVTGAPRLKQTLAA